MTDKPDLPTLPADLSGHALFLDFDGTLVGIAARPDAVHVEPALSGRIELLRRRLGGALAIVTGRPAGVIDRYLAPWRFDIAGLHGAEIRLDGVTLGSAGPDPAPLREIVTEMKLAADAHPGLLVEDKGISVALHWRVAPERAKIAVALATDAIFRLGAGYRLQEGKSVLEILPAGASKGNAIEAMMRQPPYRGRIPVFIGDDITDEHGFAAVIAQAGLAIRVGEGETIAPHRLADPAAVGALIELWAGSDPSSRSGAPATQESFA